MQFYIHRPSSKASALVRACSIHSPLACLHDLGRSTPKQNWAPLAKVAKAVNFAILSDLACWFHCCFEGQCLAFISFWSMELDLSKIVSSFHSWGPCLNSCLNIQSCCLICFFWSCCWGVEYSLTPYHRNFCPSWSISSWVIHSPLPRSFSSATGPKDLSRNILSLATILLLFHWYSTLYAHHHNPHDILLQKTHLNRCLAIPPPAPYSSSSSYSALESSSSFSSFYLR